MPPADVTSGVDCCSEGLSRARVRRLPECFPIDVPADDPFYGRHRVRCLNFLRSIPALESGCEDHPAQQVRLSEGEGHGHTQGGGETDSAASRRWRTAVKTTPHSR